MRILVTGASGFVGSQLVPRLSADGHYVRALGRDPARVRRALAQNALLGKPEPEIVQADVLAGTGLDRALGGIELAYYLIHSMERSQLAAAPFSLRERIAAENFAAAAGRAGVRRIVYLGGLVPRWSATEDGPGGRPGAGTGRPSGERRGAGLAPRSGTVSSRHLASREEVERILLAALPDSIALRASIVIGARSRSFRLLVRLVERMPVLALPPWQRFRTQPIDARDMIAMLRACTLAPLGGRHLEVGGPDVLSYGEMLGRIAELMMIGRPAVRLSVNLKTLTARMAAAIAGEDPALVAPLMEGLQGDLLPADDRAADLLGVRLHSFDAAVERALAEWERTERLAAR